MSNFALIENNQISYVIDDLPVSWKNTSGLHHSRNNEDFLNSLGWYTVQKTPVTLGVNDIIISYDYAFVDNKVIGTPVIKDTSIVENFEERKTAFMTDLRNRRNQLLSLSDWSQTLDLQEIKNDDWKTAWKTYRQALRDLPTLYENNDIIDFNLINFPTAPGE